MNALALVLDAATYGTTDRIVLILTLVAVVFLLIAVLFGGYLRRP